MSLQHTQYILISGKSVMLLIKLQGRYRIRHHSILGTIPRGSFQNSWSFTNAYQTASDLRYRHVIKYTIQYQVVLLLTCYCLCITILLSYCTILCNVLFQPKQMSLPITYLYGSVLTQNDTSYFTYYGFEMQMNRHNRPINTTGISIIPSSSAKD